MTGAVMKSIVRSRINGECFYEYHIILHPLEKRNEVTRAEAMEYIEQNGLVETYKTEDGTIWDTPDKDFLRRFKGICGKKPGRFEAAWKE